MKPRKDSIVWLFIDSSTSTTVFIKSTKNMQPEKNIFDFMLKHNGCFERMVITLFPLQTFPEG